MSRVKRRGRWARCDHGGLAVCGAWARARARVVVGGVRLAIARRHVPVVEIIRTGGALQVRERVSPSADTNGRRGGGGVSGGDEARIAVIQDRPFGFLNHYEVQAKFCCSGVFLSISS